MLSDNLENVKERVKLAAIRANRNPDDVMLIAVSKTKPAEAVKEVYDCGIRDFGENKVQEICMKKEILPEDIYSVIRLKW